MAGFAFGNSQPLRFEFTNETEVIITHGLGYDPIVYVKSDGKLAFASIEYPTSSTVRVLFQNSTSGFILIR